jgi:hypothetical protein
VKNTPRQSLGEVDLDALDFDFHTYVLISSLGGRPDTIPRSSVGLPERRETQPERHQRALLYNSTRQVGGKIDACIAQTQLGRIAAPGLRTSRAIIECIDRHTRRGLGITDVIRDDFPFRSRFVKNGVAGTV